MRQQCTDLQSLDSWSNFWGSHHKVTCCLVLLKEGILKLIPFFILKEAKGLMRFFGLKPSGSHGFFTYVQNDTTWLNEILWAKATE